MPQPSSPSPRRRVRLQPNPPRESWVLPRALLLSLLVHVPLVVLALALPATESLSASALHRPPVRLVRPPLLATRHASALSTPAPGALPSSNPSPPTAAPEDRDARTPEPHENKRHTPPVEPPGPEVPTSEHNTPATATAAAPDATPTLPHTPPKPSQRDEEPPELVRPASPDRPPASRDAASSPAGADAEGGAASPAATTTQRAVSGGSGAASPASLSGSTPPQGPGTDRAALRSAYLRALVPGVAGQHFYPQNARRLGLEGRALIALTINADGEVVALAVHRSSGHRALDDAALTALRRLPRLPPPPAALLVDGHLQVIVPMNYRLTGAPP